VPGLKMSRAINLRPLYACLVRTRKTLHLPSTFFIKPEKNIHKLRKTLLFNNISASISLTLSQAVSFCAGNQSNLSA
jgi:hypothetical protein